MKKILVADKDRGLRQLLRAVLEAARFEVAEAADGLEALELIARQRPDLVILELPLPRVGGQEICRLLKTGEKTRGLPVILLSAQGQPVPLWRAESCLPKPLLQAELLKKVQELLGTETAN